MFAIAFDMTVADMVRHHPKGVPQAYRDIAKALGPFGFEDPRECLPDEENEDLGNLVSAVMSLRRLPWLPACVRDIRGFKVENWSDFKPVMRGQQ